MKRITTAYEWILFLPALLPLFYVQGMMYPLLAPKIFALQAFGIITFAGFIFLVLSGRPFFWNRLERRGAWVPAALLAWMYLASVFGIDFYHSFWSTFERGDGLLTITVCIGYFYLLLLSAEVSWLSRLAKIVAWVGSLAALYLIFQWLVTTGTIDLSFIVKPNGRIGGTMGNAAFLAAYLGMAFFATLAAAREQEGWLRRTFYAGAILELFAILLTATRGTQVALLGIAGATLVIIAVRSGKAATYARGALLALVVLSGLFMSFRAELSRAPFEPIRRLASISLSDATVSSRLFIWQAISHEAVNRPLIGYGAEHVSGAFDRVYDPTAIAEEWFDRSHNVYLDYLLQFGILGLLLYFALIAFVIREGWLLRKAGDGRWAFILGLAAVYAMQNFFVFDTPMTFWLFLACAALALASRPDKVPETASAFGDARPIVGALAAIALLLLIIPAVIRPLKANLLAFESYQYQIVDVPRSKAAAEAGLALGTYADLEFGYNAFFMYTEEQRKRLSGSDLNLAYENAVTILAHNSERYPYDARTAVYLAQVISLPPAGVAADRALLSSALAHAISLSPKRAQPWYILTNVALGSANVYPAGSAERSTGYAAARDILSRYRALVPGLSKPHFILAQLEYAAGNTDAAAEAAEEGKKTYRSDLETAQRAARYYETVFNLSDAAFFLEEIVRLDPANTDAKDDLDKIRAYEQSKQ